MTNEWEAKVFGGCSGVGNNSLTYSFEFDSDGTLPWMEGVQFDVEDITPPAYKKLVRDMGYPDIPMKVEVTRKATSSGSVFGPYGSAPVSNTWDEPYKVINGRKSQAIIKVTGGFGLQDVKITAKRDGKEIDSYYMLCNFRQSSSTTAANNLYRDVRRKIEAQLWTNSMTNLEKLQALADYIKRSARYPNGASIDLQYNPIYKRDYAIKDIGGAPYFSTIDDPFYKAMELQGGPASCIAVYVLKDAAVEDLGIRDISDYNSDHMQERPADTSPREGIWIGTGKMSLIPADARHYSLVYRDNTGKETRIDAYGSVKNESQHNYQQNILPLN